MGLAVVQNGAIAGWGFQFFDPGKPQCTTTFFFSEVEATLVSFAEVSTMRAREIINAMDGDPAAYGNCRLEKLGEFAEGRGCLTYGVEGKSYCSRSDSDCVDGNKGVKIFNWYLKQPQA